MKEFIFEGTLNGKIIKDYIDANDKNQAEKLLKRRKIKIQKLKANPKPLLASKKVKTPELLQFTKKLTSMVTAGLPVLETIGILKSQAKSWGLKSVLKTIFNKLSEGNSIYYTFSEHPKVFDNIYLSIVGAGEQSGMLNEFLAKLSEMIEKREKIRKGLKKAFTYPIIVLTIALGISVFMLIKVIPIFENMYGGMGVDLPQFTQMLIDISKFLRTPSQGGLMVLSIVSFFLIFIFAIRQSYDLRKRYHQLLLKLPIFGALSTKSTHARLALIMANLMKAGVPIIQVLEICTTVTNNIPIKEGIEKVKNEVLTGKELSTLFGSNPIFPIELSQLIAVGEKTGNVDEMLVSIANYYEEEFDNAVDALSAAIEPLMIVVIGGIVATLLLGMYLPIFKAGEMFSGG